MSKARWLSDFTDDVRFGLRTLRKSPGFTAIAVLTLALGIGANTAIFSVVENVLLRPLPYNHPESLVEIWNTYPGFQTVGISAGDYMDYHRLAKSFSAMGAYGEVSQGFNLTGVGEPERVQASVASSDLFSMLGVRPVVGRTFLPEEDKPGGDAVVLLSHRYWQRRFGADPAVVGREVALDGRKFRVVGVLPETFQIMRTMDLWLPINGYQGSLDDHIHHGIAPIARLRPGVTVEQAGAEIETLNRQETVAYPDSHKSWGTFVHVMEDPSAAKLRATLLVLFAAVGLVLLIACANIANLLLARNAAPRTGDGAAHRVGRGAGAARSATADGKHTALSMWRRRRLAAGRSRNPSAGSACTGGANGHSRDAHRLSRSGIHNRRLPDRRNYLRLAARAACAHARPEQHPETRKQRHRRAGKSSCPQCAGHLGNCAGAGSADWCRTAVAEFPSPARRRTRFRDRARAQHADYTSCDFSR